MSETIEEIKRLIDGCGDDERKALAGYLRPYLPRHPLEEEWGVDADTILSAIRRSTDLTKRGVRGIIAEAVFNRDIIPSAALANWFPRDIPAGDWPFDALLERSGVTARIQVKLQRLEKGIPKPYYPGQAPEGLFVVEVQKTRSGTRRSAAHEGERSAAQSTRPYRFGDFDILAVNMHPATLDWRNFRFTVANWLLPRREDEGLIEIFQPVALSVNEKWTGDILTCLDWFMSGARKRVLDEVDRPAFRRGRRR